MDAPEESCSRRKWKLQPRILPIPSRVFCSPAENTDTPPKRFAGSTYAVAQLHKTNMQMNSNDKACYEQVAAVQDSQATLPDVEAPNIARDAIHPDDDSQATLQDIEAPNIPRDAIHPDENSQAMLPDVEAPNISRDAIRRCVPKGTWEELAELDCRGPTLVATTEEQLQALHLQRKILYGLQDEDEGQLLSWGVDPNDSSSGRMDAR